MINSRNAAGIGRLGGGVAGLVFFACLAVAPPAMAYTGTIHHRIADQGAEVLNLVRRGQFLPDMIARQSGMSVPPLTAQPSDVPASETALWNRFIADLGSASARLDLLLSDLPNPTLLPSQCANAWPATSAAKPLSRCRAGELPFVPERDFGNAGDVCNFVSVYYPGWNRLPEFYQSVQHSLTAGLLGRYAMKPDDLEEDTHLFVLPTNVLFIGEVKGIATEIVDLGLALLFAPGICMADLILGGGRNCIDDAENAGRQLDPIPYLDELVPGIGDISGSVLGVSLQGLWHFQNQQIQGDYNTVPGMKFSSGGYKGVIDGVDLIVLGASDFAGLTVNPDNSAGIGHYGQFADGRLIRRKGDWLVGLGHTEFEPVDNLALYGMNLTMNARAAAGAQGIGWSLHAIGDAACPMHTISAAGWGHAVWEGYTDHFWGTVGLQGPQSYPARYNQFLGIIRSAYDYWKFMDAIQTSTNTTTVPVRELVTQVAHDTFVAADGLYFPAISVVYAAAVLADNATSQRLIETLFYGSDANTGTIRFIVDRATGATAAYLAKAARVLPTAPPPTPQTTDDPCVCPAGSARVAMDLTGTPVNSDTCVACGQGAFTAMPVNLDGICVAACPSDKPFNQNGTCVATCTGSCTGTACPANLPFVNNGTCVAHCPAKVVNNRVCANACPAGQEETPPGTGFCLPIAAPDPRVCNSGGSKDATPACRCGSDFDCGARFGQPATVHCEATTCCVAAGAGCNSGAVCCSLVCGSSGKCLAGPGDACSTNADCGSNTCTGGHCSPRTNGQGCRQNSDCISNDCRQGFCFGGAGGSCTTNADCTAGICVQNKCCFDTLSFCSVDSDCCAGTVCSGGVCKAKTGQGCETANECVSGNCQGSKCCVFTGCQTSADCCGGGTCPTPGGACSIVAPPG